MFRRSTPRTSLKLEALETREVPAVVLQGTFNNTGATVTPDGGAVTIQEVALISAANGSTINGMVRVEDANGTMFVAVNKSATANDTLTLSNNGGTLTINASDGIFVRFAFGAETRFRSVGNTLDVPNVTGLNVDLQLGGDDTVTDNTTFSSTINGGAGNDTLTGGGTINPALLPFLSNPAFLPLLAGMGGQKTLQGGTGDDKINGPLVGFFNQLDGGEGNDTIIGGLGREIITGGNGFDVLFGLGGGDFYIAFDFGPDFVLDQPGDLAFTDPFDL